MESHGVIWMGRENKYEHRAISAAVVALLGNYAYRGNAQIDSPPTITANC
jgi:hypothetical protein